MPNPANYLLQLLFQGVDGWGDFRPRRDNDTNLQYVHDIASRIYAATGEDCIFAQGSTRADGPWPLCIYAVTPDLIVEAFADPDSMDSPLVDVRSRKVITSIRILSAPLETGTHVLLSGYGDLEFAVSYPFGTVRVGKHQGTAEQRREWLEAFKDDLIGAM